MRCEDVQANLADYLGGSLPAAVRDAIARHLRECPRCASEFDEMRDMWQMLDALPAAVADSSAMRTRFTHMLAAHTALPRPAGSASPLVRTQWTATRWAAWGAAAAALLVIGFAAGRASTRHAQTDPQIAVLREELRDMRQMVTLSLLQQQSASERLKGVTWTSQIDRPGDELTVALLDALIHDPNVNVRLATVDALRRFADRESVRKGAAEALLRQTSPLVQIALIDFVVEVNDRAASDALRRLADDPMADAAVRARAAEGLEQMG